jgi:hypothetical protein
MGACARAAWAPTETIPIETRRTANNVRVTSLLPHGSLMPFRMTKHLFLEFSRYSGVTTRVAARSERLSVITRYVIAGELE